MIASITATFFFSTTDIDLNLHAKLSDNGIFYGSIEMISK